jgi:protein subunit release factor A
VSHLLGTHRIQRIPANDRSGRRHTSTATIALVNVESNDVEVAEKDLRIDFYRGHGKGGQHRNKTSSAVRLTHLPTGTVVVVERGRSQSQNLTQARAELLARLGARADDATNKRSNATRKGQISTGERPVKQWTWNEQRNEVLHHDSGQRWRMDEFLSSGMGLLD